MVGLAGFTIDTYIHTHTHTHTSIIWYPSKYLSSIQSTVLEIMIFHHTTTTITTATTTIVSVIAFPFLFWVRHHMTTPTTFDAVVAFYIEFFLTKKYRKSNEKVKNRDKNEIKYKETTNYNVGSLLIDAATATTSIIINNNNNKRIQSDPIRSSLLFNSSNIIL